MEGQVRIGDIKFNVAGKGRLLQAKKPLMVVSFTVDTSMTAGPGSVTLVQPITILGYSEISIHFITYSSRILKATSAEYDITDYTRLRVGQGLKIDAFTTGGFLVCDGNISFNRPFFSVLTNNQLSFSCRFFIDRFQLDYPGYTRDLSDLISIEFTAGVAQS